MSRDDRYRFPKTKLWPIAAALAWALSPAPARPQSISPTPIPVQTSAAPFGTQALGQRWNRNILGQMTVRYCDSENGEEIGWLISPMLDGFYYGYLATGDRRWIDRLVDWTDSWLRRGIIEPDGYLGWPKPGAAGNDVDNLNSYDADSLLGEAMALRPVVLMSALIQKDPALRAQYGRKADSYIRLAAQMFDKWNSRAAWRTNGDITISVVLPFGIDRQTGGWTDGYQQRHALNQGFSHQDNKANMVASWLLAMSDATGDPRYRDKAAGWFRLMKSRMHVAGDGSYRIWNYWEPAGPWDYRPDGTPKHWIGTHPNAGYYAIDVEAIVTAHEHGIEFTDEDIRRLVQTAAATARLWPALAPYDASVKQRFERTLNPDGWAEMVLIPEYLTGQTLRAD